MLTTDAVMSELNSKIPALRKLGVRRLGLFGSTARGAATNASDLDFVVELDPKTFDSYMDVKEFLEECFRRPVDLVIADAVKPQLRDRIFAETIYAEGL